MLDHEMIFKGQVLSQAQIDVLAKLPTDITNLSSKNFRKAIDIALTKAGMPVPDIQIGQVVSWRVGTGTDKGKVISYDERADKYRVFSKNKKREFTVRGNDIRVSLGKETADADSAEPQENP
jgi:hypothetical protein